MIACRRVGAGSSDPLAACSITKKQVERQPVALSNLRKVASDHQKYVVNFSYYFHICCFYVFTFDMCVMQGEGIEGGTNQQAWDKWSNDGTEPQVPKLMEEDVAAAMQFLQSKALCMMPICRSFWFQKFPISKTKTKTIE